MENGAPPSDLQSFASEIRDANTQAEKEDILDRGQSKELEASNNRKEVEFKATHGLLIAFLVLVMCVQAVSNLRSNDNL